MSKLTINTTANYSPNFDVKKRNFKQIKYIIFHYTGMKNENDAIKKLTSFKSKVSCHYFIKSNGKILTLVPDLYIAWHAGISYWKNKKHLNKKTTATDVCFLYLDNLDFLKESIIKLNDNSFNEYKDYEKINLVPSFAKLL